MAIDLNAQPYNDDFSESKDFYRILFKPGYPVQARELTQLQTILQQQITRHGNNIFKEGAMVIPGNTSFDDQFHYVKLQASYGPAIASTVIESLDGEIVVGGTSGVRAVIKKHTATDGTNPDTIYVNYLNSGTDNVTAVFADNELLTPEDPALSTLLVKTQATGATGKSSLVSIKEGIYFIRGTFARVADQDIILDPYTNTPSYRIGLTIEESIISSEEDESLLDNAQGTPNFAAPGADRYNVTLTLNKLALDSVLDENFVEILRIENGVIQYKIERTEYSVLEQTLARRTFDESGNYVIKPFGIDVREHRNNNRSDWETATTYAVGDIVLNGANYYVSQSNAVSGNIPPTHTTGTAADSGVGGVTWLYTTNPVFNRGIYTPEQGGDESKLAIGIEPSKAYVQGYEIEKIATSYVPVPKSRDSVKVADTKINATVGNYVLVTNINNIPLIDVFATLDLYDNLSVSPGAPTGSKIGTCKVKAIEYHSGTIGTSAAIYKLSIFDIKLDSGKDFNRNVKMFYYDGGTVPTSFTADVNPVLVQLTGSATASSTTVTGTGTLFNQQLQLQDYIQVGSNTRRVTAIVSNISLTVSASVTVTGEAIFLLTTEILEPNNSSLIFPLPNYAIKTVRSADNTIGTSYTVYEKFVRTGGAVNTITLTVTGGNDTFASEAATGNYIVVDNVTGSHIVPSAITRLSGNTQVQIDFGTTYTNLIIIAAVNKSGTGTEKTKTLTTTSVTKTTLSSAAAQLITLGYADGYSLVSVKMDTGDFTTPSGTYSIDISDRYVFNDGQTNSFYDLASITLLPGSPVPVAPIQITFKYFAHSTTGDYFTVNSYLSTIDYKDIPYFNSTPLRDCIDFRPRVANAGTVFSGTGSSVNGVPKRGIDIEADFEYYLSRKDKIAIDARGNYFVISGISSLTPIEPNDPSEGMVLFNLEYEPYTFGTSNDNVIRKAVDNKRYTMRDIGKLEKRIDNLEYYTSLSLLEQDTKSLSIPDSDGLERYKNGFIVDSFTGHGVGDVNQPDYRCSVDMEAKTLKPFFNMKNVNLIESNSNNTDRTTDGYQLTGDIITLPYTNVEFIKQPYASRAENVNPFAIFTFLGSIDLNPSSDEWFETNRLPDIVTNVEGNFDTILTIAQSSGVLGTVWNAWQTQWTGTPVSQGVSQDHIVIQNGGNAAAFNSRWGTAARRDSAATRSDVGIRTVTYETFAQQVGQSRTGINTSVVAKIDRNVTDDRLVSTAVIPYIRSRNLAFLARGLKPETKFYPFFDSIDISDYITPATKVDFTALSGFGSNFDYSTNVGGVSDEAYRQVGGASDVALNRGDVIFVVERASVIYSVNNAPGTAVAMLQQTTAAGDRSVFISNIKGNFLAGDKIAGTVSGARGTITTTPTVLTQGGDLVSTLNGDLAGLFMIPNTDSIRFRTGQREFKLTNSELNGTDFTSQGRKTYLAQGIIETKQASVTATRNAEIVRNTVTQSQTVLQRFTKVISDTGWYDPLAQTFLIQQPGGAFITKVDVFFEAKDSAIPVQLEIREVVNGYPGKAVIPFSRIIMTPDNISVSADATVATPFIFPSPIYLQDSTEYCLVLLSDSNEYKVWISQLGEKNIGTDRYISEQPYAGVLFKSQNASTWTADQLQDLKFTIHRASFTTGQYGEVEFVNDSIKPTTLAIQPFQTVTGTNKVRVFHNDHQLPDGSTVTISNVTASVNGIPASEFNASHVISNVELDSYVITLTTNATTSGYAGNDDVVATESVQFDVVEPVIQYQNFTDTTCTFDMKTMSGKAVSGSQIPYIIDSTFSGVSPNDNNYFTSPRMIADKTNETLENAGAKSFTLRATMFSNNEAVSPVIDTHRLSLIAVNNKVNIPTSASINVAALDTRTIVSASTNIAVANSVISSADSSTQNLLKTVSVGRYITLSGYTSSAVSNNGDWLVTAVDSVTGDITVDGSFVAKAAGLDPVTIVSQDRFIDEMANQSSTYSKYMTKKVNIQNISTFLKIQFAANVPPASNILVYYKTSLASDISAVNYVLATPDADFVKSADQKFYDVTYSISDIPPFDAVTVKLAFTSSNSSEVPTVKDLRIIACA
jgi:hypothetical protein